MHCDCFKNIEDLIFVYYKLSLKTAKITPLENLYVYGIEEPFKLKRATIYCVKLARAGWCARGFFNSLSCRYMCVSTPKAINN